MKRYGTILAATLIAPTLATAVCVPPSPPPLTNEDMARKFRNEFRAEFEQYFTDAQAYMLCLEAERADVVGELRFTAERYERFLRDVRAGFRIDLLASPVVG